jgi:hypothetical protein
LGCDRLTLERLFGCLPLPAAGCVDVGWVGGGFRRALTTEQGSSRTNLYDVNSTQNVEVYVQKIFGVDKPTK